MVDLFCFGIAQKTMGFVDLRASSLAPHHAQQELVAKACGPSAMVGHPQFVPQILKNICIFGLLSHDTCLANTLRIWRQRPNECIFSQQPRELDQGGSPGAQPLPMQLVQIMRKKDPRAHFCEGRQLGFFRIPLLLLCAQLPER